MNTNTTAQDGVVSGEQLGGEPRWYCLSADGMATLCVDEEDAKEVAAESWVLYPKNAPYRATQMVEASVVAAAVAAEREKYDVLFEAFNEACARGALARREIDLALPAMREYARKNPKHHFSTDGTEQDPCGAHAWLERNGKPNTNSADNPAA